MTTIPLPVTTGAATPVARAATGARAAAWPRRTLGTLLLLHGLAHAAPGMWAAGRWPAWFVTPTWALAMVGLMGAGLGLLGAPVLDRWWRQLAASGALASLVVLVSVGDAPALVGLLLDPLVVLTALEWGPVAHWSESRGEREAAGTSRGRRARRAVAFALSALLLAWVAVAVLARPWHSTWGTTAAQRAARLPGDELLSAGGYRMDHAITIAAPAEAVWPWVAQLGQDRAGFYSYAWLERAFGVRIRNADEVRPEWQWREPGALLPATQPGYLWGAFDGRPGWRVLLFEPGRAMVLKGWGSFVVEPLSGGRSRLHVRLRGDDRPSLAGVALGPLGLLAFEPAHFIMERGMLRGIRDRAERRQAS